MNIQINGLQKSSDTRKAIRFFKERRIPVHIRDVTEKPLAPREIEKICSKIDPEELIDSESKEYTKRGLQYMTFDPIEEIAEDPLLLKMPIVRNGSDVTVGYDPETWDNWIKESSQ